MSTIDLYGPYHYDTSSGNNFALHDAGGQNTFLFSGDNLHISGGSGSESIYLAGDHTGSFVYAGSGSDVITGGSGADHLFGSTSTTGSDVLSGGGGNDFIHAGNGHDAMSGGSGADTFDFGSGTGTHVITDFHSGDGDLIQFAHNINGTGITDSTTLDAYVSAHSTMVGSNLVIDLSSGHGTDTLTVNNAPADMGSHASSYIHVV
jgi:Ca2+-binding RTX toxin-like protein